MHDVHIRLFLTMLLQFVGNACQNYRLRQNVNTHPFPALDFIISGLIYTQMQSQTVHSKRNNWNPSINSCDLYIIR